MSYDPKQSLKEAFGYVPDEANGERWVIYFSGSFNTLIVVHPYRQPRLYPQGCGGKYTEIAVDPPVH